MKHMEWKTIVLMGLSTGLLTTNALSAITSSSNASSKTNASGSKAHSGNNDDPNDGNLNYHVMTEDELLLELDSDGIAMYKSLSPEGKALALLVASARCNGSNACKGLNACKTEKNDCAGKGACKGQGKCAVADKNLAVKLVRNKLMAEKRSQVMNHH